MLQVGPRWDPRASSLYASPPPPSITFACHVTRTCGRSLKGWAAPPATDPRMTAAIAWAAGPEVKGGSAVDRCDTSWIWASIQRADLASPSALSSVTPGRRSACDAEARHSAFRIERVDEHALDAPSAILPSSINRVLILIIRISRISDELNEISLLRSMIWSPSWVRPGEAD